MKNAGASSRFGAGSTMQSDEASMSGESMSKASRRPGASPKSTKQADILAGIICASLLVLLLLYVTVSDQHPVSEFLTIWPPVLYLVPSVVILGILGWRNSNRQRIVSTAMVALFAVTLIEWRPLLRFSSGKGDFTVVTWNIGGGYPSELQLLRGLEDHQPGIIFFQESPDHAGAFSGSVLPAAFEGYHYYDSGDCATLSRWPCEVLESRSVGPWSHPQLLLAEIDGRRVLLANVRLMLPSLILDPWNARSREKLWQDNQTRREQYPLLVELIDDTRRQHQIDHVILAGDFNTDASARSLNVIRGEFTDAWTARGAGWGGTAINGFPVARIDHIYVRDFRPESVRVMPSPFSDHHPVVATLSFVPTRLE